MRRALLLVWAAATSALLLPAAGVAVPCRGRCGACEPGGGDRKSGGAEKSLDFHLTSPWMFRILSVPLRTYSRKVERDPSGRP